MKLKQDGCDICGEMEPLTSILMNEGLQDLCKTCWEWLLSKEGE